MRWGLIPPRSDDTQTQNTPYLASYTDNTLHRIQPPFIMYTSPASVPFYIVSFFFSYLLLLTLIYLGLDLDSLLLVLFLALLYCTIVYFVGLSETTNTIKFQENTTTSGNYLHQKFKLVIMRTYSVVQIISLCDMRIFIHQDDLGSYYILH